MKRFLRFLRFLFLSVIVVVVLAGSLLVYFVYSPAPSLPRESGTLSKGSLEVGGLERTYLSYIPRGLAHGAPLVVVMHGPGEDGAQIRIETGYEFERLADEHGFAVVYPDSYSSDWNDCGRVGRRFHVAASGAGGAVPISRGGGGIGERADA
jgi:polyhydroxybutyrate depolymerase